MATSPMECGPSYGIIRASKFASSSIASRSPLWTFSFMEYYCLTGLWNVQRDPRNRPQIENRAKSATGLLVVGHMQTVFRFGLQWTLFFPFVKDIVQFLLLAKFFATRRANQTDDDLKGQRDMWSTLFTSKDADTGKHFTLEQLTSEAGLLITAGRGTAILTTCSTLFYLLRNPRTLARVADDIRTAFPGPSDYAGKSAVATLDVPNLMGEP